MPSVSIHKELNLPLVQVCNLNHKLLVQITNLNQIFYSSAHAEERSVTIKEKRGASSALPSENYNSKI